MTPIIDVTDVTRTFGSGPNATDGTILEES